MAIRSLNVFLDQLLVGEVRQDQSGRLEFIYSDDWLHNTIGIPLSLSMPLTDKKHNHDTLLNFMWGLLPDNVNTLRSWGHQHNVSPRSAFALLSQVGADCSGAVRFHPTREAEVNPIADGYHLMDTEEVAKRIKALREDPGQTRTASDSGQFSLAGAQTKTAFLSLPQGWAVPMGNIPTTHIFKPPLADFEGHIENEHLSLQLAKRAGLSVADSKVLTFNDEQVISIERFDRFREGDTIHRIHQEDFCQALGVHPDNKYEKDGGPGIKRCMDLLQDHSDSPDKDRNQFMRAIAFNVLIGGTDAHAKNYAILHGKGGTVKLAPLYDLGSILPYDETHPFKKMRLAMKIGNHYELDWIFRRDLEKSAKGCRYDLERAVAHVQDLADALPDYAADSVKVAKSQGLTHPTLDRYADQITVNCKRFKSRFS